MAAPATIGYTDLAAVQAGGANILANLLDPNFTFGRLKEIEATYVMTGSEAANDAVYIARIPGGCLPSAVNGSIASVGGAPATTLTCSIGDTDTAKDSTGVATRAYDPARYSAAVDIHAQTTTTPVGFSGGTELVTNAPQQPVVDDWCWLLATFATVGTPVAGKKVVFRIQVKALD